MRKKWVKSTLLIVLQVIIWRILFKIPNFSVLWFKLVITNYNKFVFSITSKINISLSEFFYAIILIGFIIVLIKYKSISKLLNYIFIICFIYNGLWGIVYSKANFSDATNNIVIDKEQLKKMYCTHLNQAEFYRHQINKNSKKVTEFKTTEQDYLADFKIQEQRLSNEDWIFNYQLIENPLVKWANFSLAMNYFGVLGYYNPFTIESNINQYDTDLKLPFTISHELAHQMGFASENQANFIAYYIGVHSSLNEVKYAVYYKTMFSILHSIYNYDPLFVVSQMESLPEGIKMDRDAEIEYYSKFEGKANSTFSAINDSFLKMNNQEGKISYSRYIELVYFYEQIKKANL